MGLILLDIYPAPVVLALTGQQWLHISLSVGLGALALLIAWFVLHRWVHALYRWIDDLIPADLSPFSDITVRTIMLLLSLAILGGVALSIATTVGADTSGTLNSLRALGAAALAWLLPRLLRIALVMAVAMVLLRVLRAMVPPLVRRYLTSRREDADPGEVEKRSRTLESVAVTAFSWVIITIAFFVILAELGLNIAPILAGAGVAAVAIGFGAQNLIRDILAGIFILLEDHYRVGDVVKIAGIGGLVEDINLRRTVLRDLDFVVHVIPNGEVRIASNYTKEKSRVNLNISVAYRTDLDHAIAVLNRVGKELSEDPYFGPLITQPLQVLRVDAFEDSGIAIKVLGETKPIRQWEVAGEYRKRVKKAFDQEGIEIPFPHRTIYWGEGVETKIRQLLDDKANGTHRKGKATDSGQEPATPAHEAGRIPENEEEQ